jgi:hypothetical protein
LFYLLFLQEQIKDIKSNLFSSLSLPIVASSSFSFALLKFSLTHFPALQESRLREAEGERSEGRERESASERRERESERERAREREIIKKETITGVPGCRLE